MIPGDEPRVYLVGAGPGNPGYLTVRAQELLQQADSVLYDQLVPRRLLDVVRPGAELVCVRDLPGKHPDKYPHIFEFLIERARAGQVVVRLKGGDPLIFGRGGEEAEALRAAGLAYEIVPGVTAALAAGACLDLPLTHRRAASAIALVTGHELPMKPGNQLDWQAIARFPGTLAIYMGIARLPLIVAELLKFGKSPTTPAAIIERAGTGEMRTTFAPLVELDQARRHAGLEAPGLILIGDVIPLRAAQSWFEKRPLFGRRLLVTRPKHQAEPLMRQLEHLGAVPDRLPAVRIDPPDDLAAFHAALNAIAQDRYDWIVWTSPNGVLRTFQEIQALGGDARWLGRTKLAVVGSGTAARLRERGFSPDFVPPRAGDSEALGQALCEPLTGQRVLVIQGQPARMAWLEALRPRTRQLDHAVAYQQKDAIHPEDEPLAALRRGEIHGILISSANIARVLLQSLDDTTLNRIRRGEIHCIVQSAAVGEVVAAQGLPVAGCAAEPTMAGLVAACIQVFQNGDSSAAATWPSQVIEDLETGESNWGD